MKLEDINYTSYGRGDDVVILHGWGQNIEMMQPLANTLYNKRITIIDLPGFGKSTKINKAISLEGYVELVHELMEELEIKKPFIIGHSFGGKLAIMYAARYEVKGVILLAPTVFKSKEKKFKKNLFKILKTIPLINRLEEFGKQLLGSTDYKNATPLMREILVKHLEYDAGNDASLIKAPTIILWGKYDQAVSYYTVSRLEELVKDGALIETDGTHYAYLEYLPFYSRVINEFMEGVND